MIAVCLAYELNLWVVTPNVAAKGQVSSKTCIYFKLGSGNGFSLPLLMDIFSKLARKSAVKTKVVLPAKLQFDDIQLFPSLIENYGRFPSEIDFLSLNVYFPNLAQNVGKCINNLIVSTRAGLTRSISLIENYGRFPGEIDFLSLHVYLPNLAQKVGKCTNNLIVSTRAGLFRVNKIVYISRVTRYISWLFMLDFAPKLSRVSGNAEP